MLVATWLLDGKSEGVSIEELSFPCRIDPEKIGKLFDL